MGEDDPKPPSGDESHDEQIDDEPLPGLDDDETPDQVRQTREQPDQRSIEVGEETGERSDDLDEGVDREPATSFVDENDIISDMTRAAAAAGFGRGLKRRYLKRMPWLWRAREVTPEERQLIEKALAAHPSMLRETGDSTGISGAEDQNEGIDSEASAEAETRQRAQRVGFLGTFSFFTGVVILGLAVAGLFVVLSGDGDSTEESAVDGADVSAPADQTQERSEAPTDVGGDETPSAGAADSDASGSVWPVMGSHRRTMEARASGL